MDRQAPVRKAEDIRVVQTGDQSAARAVAAHTGWQRVDSGVVAPRFDHPDRAARIFGKPRGQNGAGGAAPDDQRVKARAGHWHARVPGALLHCQAILLRNTLGS